MWEPQPSNINFVEIGNEIISVATLSQQLIQVGKLSVTDESMYACSNALIGRFSNNQLEGSGGSRKFYWMVV